MRTIDEIIDKKHNEIHESLQFQIDKVNDNFAHLENRVKSLEQEKPMNAYVENNTDEPCPANPKK